MTPILVVFARAPRPGQVKTRMTPPLPPEQAAAFYACLLQDVLELSAREAPRLGLDVVLAVHPPGACAELAQQAPRPLRVVPQRGPDLAHRMDWAVREAAAGGFSPILLRGSDSPTLDGSTLALALTSLQDADLVICPDRDGGYNLVGLGRPASGLFDHPMSTASVLEDTLSNARRLGLESRVLDAGFDLDTVSDLRWLARARRERDDLPCPRTLRFLDTHGLWEQIGT
jgi:rSAM/selenodomain-associated transferase 1